MNKILVCPDSFKGSLSAQEVTDYIAEILSSELKDIEIETLPLADGGEGTSAVLKEFYPYKQLVEASDPLGRKINTQYYLDRSGEKAFLESAEIIGLPLLVNKEREPLKTGSQGLGELILEAINKNVKEINISLGGSATCDGGMGMLSKLGYNFKDIHGRLLNGNGFNLTKIDSIEKSKNFCDLSRIKINAICDVNNPLLGVNGAAYVFAPQKGASKDDVLLLDKGLKNLVDKAHESKLVKQSGEFSKGAGAAGGLGYALLSFFNAELVNGIDLILEVNDFQKKLNDTSLVITGEGKIDRQSMMGKVLSGVLRHTFIKNIPVIAFGGIIEEPDFLKQKGLTQMFQISDPLLSIGKNMEKEQTYKNLKKAIKNMLNSNIVKQILS